MSMAETGEESEGEWEEWTEEDEEADAVKSLFDDHYLPSSDMVLQYDKEKNGFDLQAFKRREGLDDYGVIKCVNFIRSEVKAGRDPRPQLETSTGPKPWLDDAYLKPVLQDDGLLFHEFEDDPIRSDEPSGSGEGGSGPLASEVARLREANHELHQLVQELLTATLPQELREERRAANLEGEVNRGDDSATASTSTSTTTTFSPAGDNIVYQIPDGPGPDGLPPLRPGAIPSRPSQSRRERDLGRKEREMGLKEKVDSVYFDSYSYLDIHKDMLADKVRTEAYRVALECNPKLMAGARVLDVGCGTGILSMFAARGGAARVVGVEGSNKMAELARQIVASNGLDVASGGPVHIVSGKLEELEGEAAEALEEGGKVDVLVSEWMGYALLFESMLDTVLYARDRYLKYGGAVLPDKAVVCLAGATEAATGMDFWKDVYGFSMNVVREHFRAAEVSKAEVGVVAPESIITDTVQIQEFDLCSMSPGDQDFSARFSLTAAGSSASGPPEEECHALVLWFTTEFTSRFCEEKSVVLSTSPFEPKTHWAQAIFTLPKPVPLYGDKSLLAQKPTAKMLTGRFSMARSNKHRSLDISIEYRAELSDGQVIDEICSYVMDVIL